jgi:hypothetical protein
MAVRYIQQSIEGAPSVFNQKGAVQSAMQEASVDLVGFFRWTKQPFSGSAPRVLGRAWHPAKLCLLQPPDLQLGAHRCGRPMLVNK